MKSTLPTQQSFSWQFMTSRVLGLNDILKECIDFICKLDTGKLYKKNILIAF